jgi:hypothetical protein
VCLVKSLKLLIIINDTVNFQGGVSEQAQAAAAGGGGRGSLHVDNIIVIIIKLNESKEEPEIVSHAN